MAEDASKTLKICLVGDGSSGKTSIVHQYCQEHFGQAYLQTVGLDFYMKRLVLPGDVHITLKLWDIGGQSLGSKMVRTYIDGCAAICLVYDVTNRDSFDNLDDWHRLVERHYDDKKDKEKSPKLALIGNKIDMAHLRTVPSTEHNAWAQSHNCVPFFASAKTGHNLNAVFREVVARVTGIQVTPDELEHFEPVITATITAHPTIAPAMRDEQDEAEATRRGGKGKGKGKLGKQRARAKDKRGRSKAKGQKSAVCVLQ